MSSFSVSLHGHPSVSVCVLISSSYKGTYWIWTHPNDLILINSLKTFSLDRVTHPELLEVRASISELWRGHKIAYGPGYCQN